MSERAACRLVGLPRSMQRLALVVAGDEPELVKCLQRLLGWHDPETRPVAMRVRGGEGSCQLNGEIFTGLAELSYVLRSYRRDYNDVRPHSGIGYLTPSAFAARCGLSGSASVRLQAHTSTDACAALKRMSVAV